MTDWEFKMSLVLADDDYHTVKRAISDLDASRDLPDSKSDARGQAIAAICREWLADRAKEAANGGE